MIILVPVHLHTRKVSLTIYGILAVIRTQRFLAAQIQYESPYWYLGPDIIFVSVDATISYAAI
jgi:hypothetical protein